MARSISNVGRCLSLSVFVGSVLLAPVPEASAQGLPRIIYEREAAGVATIDFSPDSKFLATGGLLEENPYPLGQIRFWKTKGGVLIGENTLDETLGYTNEVQFSPSGDRVASANGVVDCYPQGGCFPYKAGQFVWSFPGGQVLAGGQAPHLVAGIDWSPDGSMLATAEYYTSQEVKIYDASFNLVRTLPGHDGGSYAVRFSPDGQLLASGGADATVKVWRVSDGTLLDEFEGTEFADSTSLNFSPDGALLAAGYFGDTLAVRVWRIQDGQLLYSISDPTYGAGNTVAFAPDGKYFAAGSASYISGEGWIGLIRFWCTSNGQLVRVYKDDRVLNAGVGGFSIAPNGLVFAYGYAGRLIVAKRPALPSVCQ